MRIHRFCTMPFRATSANAADPVILRTANDNSAAMSSVREMV